MKLLQDKMKAMIQDITKKLALAMGTKELAQKR